MGLDVNRNKKHYMLKYYDLSKKDQCMDLNLNIMDLNNMNAKIGLLIDNEEARLRVYCLEGSRPYEYCKSYNFAEELY